MAYINSLIGKHMPQRPITVAGTPKVHAIYDMITSTSATEGRGSIRLPEAFYDHKLREIVDRIAYEEEFGGYGKDRELRSVGIGAMLGDVVESLVGKAESGIPSTPRPAPMREEIAVEETNTRLWLYGTHDSTLSAAMASLGADKTRAGELRWPPYGSVLAIELLKDTRAGITMSQSCESPTRQSYAPISRTPVWQLSQVQTSCLQDYYVRVRYNNRSLVLPGCRSVGKNWDGDGTLCTLLAFKEIVDEFTPADWQKSCLAK